MAALALNDNSIVDWDMYDNFYENYTWNITERAILTSHRMEDMLLECRWNTGQTCTAENFTTVITDFGVMLDFQITFTTSYSPSVFAFILMVSLSPVLDLSQSVGAL